jgi:hypothetical protein
VIRFAVCLVSLGWDSSGINVRCQSQIGSVTPPNSFPDKALMSGSQRLGLGHVARGPRAYLTSELNGTPPDIVGPRAPRRYANQCTRYVPTPPLSSCTLPQLYRATSVAAEAVPVLLAVPWLATPALASCLLPSLPGPGLPSNATRPAELNHRFTRARHIHVRCAVMIPK